MAAVAPERAGAPAAAPFEKNKDESMMWRNALVVLCPVLGVLLLFVPSVEEVKANPNPDLHEVTTNAILIILTALVIISLTFEALEEGLEHMLDEVFMPVLNALNNELMGLGFLAVIMYFVLHFGVLITIGEHFLCTNCDPCHSGVEKYDTDIVNNPGTTRPLAQIGMTPTHPLKVSYVPGAQGMTRMVSHLGVDGASEWKAGSALPMPPEDMLTRLGPRPQITDHNPYL